MAIAMHQNQWSDWVPFNATAVAALAPKAEGIYAFDNGGDVIYIGKAEQGVQGRLQQHLSAEDNPCLKQAFRGTVKVCWLLTSNPKQAEHSALVDYQAKHGRLPHCNRNLP